jgi:hypothetical protein
MDRHVRPSQQGVADTEAARMKRLLASQRHQLIDHILSKLPFIVERVRTYSSSRTLRSVVLSMDCASESSLGPAQRRYSAPALLHFAAVLVALPRSPEHGDAA